ncbi:DUF2955 domain-containing protein [Congregibacter variabilis]|uniref:DUF2955 domain-containing protein n=1 Tax=Congregibacter variabilis TaxID=3081200 RepID=A0ABZ0I2F0_9GAMM|nr:DUF2955 domain-containing protein [Congregibacter sp. IMCC43200]
MSVAESRALRFAFATALALAMAYGLSFPLPFLAPLFVVFLSAMPGPPMGPKGLFALLVVMSLSLTVGVLLIPLIRYYPVSAVLIVAVGLYFSMYLTLIHGKRLLGTFLTIGFTLISVAGSVDYLLATTVIKSLALGISAAVLCQWLVYPFFPENASAAPAAEAPEGEVLSNWLAVRAMLIVMPAYLLALTNPSQYLMTIMKSVSLGQQTSAMDARHAGRELIGSTFVGGIMAITFWVLLTIAPNLWMFSLWMLLFALYTAAKLYGFLKTRVAPSFWINALVTMLILLGPAVEDSANGKDALTAFIQRFATFIAVTLYAWGALAFLENWRNRRLAKTREAIDTRS